MGHEIVTTKFELRDGREFQCQYAVWYDEGDFWSPPDSEVYEPEFKLDGKIVDEKDLPKGLAELAQIMYENPDDKRFVTTTVTDDGTPDDFGCD